MKNWHLFCLWERLFPFMPMPGANPVLVRKGGSHTVRQAANLSVMMVLLVPRKKHALTEV
ncbi:hypothetical protein BANRA_02253 [Escherichia coli]|nr:hypothetical protein BANRA_02253 [Escherichia coli]